MRVAELDMTNSSHQCPSGLRQRTDSNIRTCAIATVSTGACLLVTFPTLTVEYSRVCGRIRAYQVGSLDTFVRSTNPTLEGNYVDGVSLTHGNLRQHIWTFAGGLDESDNANNCLCQESGTATPPAFVGNNYFCDTGAENYDYNVFYSDDPLWDGTGCGPGNTCCSFNDPPWFYRQLTEPTTDAIEMRVCRDDPLRNEEIAVERVEIYVQ